MAAATGSLSVQLLGPLRVWRGDQEIVVGPPKQRALLALLATHRGTVVGSTQIIDALWGPEPPNTAMNGVHTYVAGLRRALEPTRRGRERGEVLLSTAGGYELRLPLEAVDASLFVQQCEEVRRLSAEGQSDAAFETLGRALGLWRGDALAGVPGPFAAMERSRLREMRFSAAEDWIAGMIAAGRSEEAIVVAGEAIAQEPLRERLRYLLMLALYRCGRQAHALHAYSEARSYLREELGIEPGAELQALHAKILAGTVDEAAPPARLPSTPPPARPEAAAPPAPSGSGLSPRQLPSRAHVFVGRDAEQAKVRELLADSSQAGGRGAPILVIDGPPGVGKSALALELGNEYLSRFPDGQLYASLGGTTDCPRDPFDVLGGLLESLGVSREVQPPCLDGRVLLYRSLLHGKRMMILLDDAVDLEQIRPLIPQGPTCLMVTSRRPQRGLVARYGAHRIHLKPLDPVAAAELLVKLLGGEVIQGSERAIQRLVEQCGYLPLGIRITAAALLEDPYGSPERLAALYEDPAIRLDLLAVAGDDEMSLRAALTASYRNLPSETSRLFRLLSRVGLDVIDAPESSRLLGVHRCEVTTHLELLADLGLLERVGPSSYRFGELTRIYADECAEAERLAQQQPPPRRLTPVVTGDDGLRTG
ncbi:BTAD domain-containing putative transcriptional regulator [Streptomyces sp. NPDC018693]